MKITLDPDELARVEALLPESAKMLIHVLGYATTARLINRFGGVSLAAKSGERKEQTGGVFALLRDEFNEQEVQKLIDYIGGEHFYIPRCDVALRQLRNARFIAAVAERQEMGLSIRQAMAVLCPQFGISDRLGWELISQSAGQSGRQQQNLF